MNFGNAKKAYLLLEDGTIYTGKSFGAQGELISEISFCTSSTGYQEALSDPANYKQIIVQTFPLIGNYGVNKEDDQSNYYAGAFVVREYCEIPSNFRCEGTLNDYLVNKNIIGLYDIDTRALTRRLRKSGEMKALITTSEIEAEKMLDKIKNSSSEITSKDISTKIKINDPLPHNYSKYNVTIIDYGYKKALYEMLGAMNCNVTVVPHDTSAKDIIADKPDGIVLSGGFYTTLEIENNIKTINELMEYDVPILGINYGHLLYAQANGLKIEKMKYGHRGENHPIVDTDNNQIFIASQNHNYVVVSESVGDIAKIKYINGNDGTCEGLEYKNAFTVQFQPEACGGPQDAEFIFEHFIDMMKEEK